MERCLCCAFAPRDAANRVNITAPYRRGSDNGHRHRFLTVAARIRKMTHRDLSALDRDEGLAITFRKVSGERYCNMEGGALPCMGTLATVASHKREV